MSPNAICWALALLPDGVTVSSIYSTEATDQDERPFIALSGDPVAGLAFIKECATYYAGPWRDADVPPAQAYQSRWHIGILGVNLPREQQVRVGTVEVRS